MKLKKYSELIFGLIILAFDVFYFILTTQIPRKGAIIDATFVPYLLCAIFTLLAVLQIVHGVRVMKNFDAAQAKPENVDVKTVAYTLACIAIYILVLEPIGFILSTTAFLFCMFTILTPVHTKRNYILYGIIAVATALFVYLAFRYGLSLMLPQGLIKVV